ncbi:hypothetical protein MRX96_020069 [Rhipicephalus microplus]
MGLQLPPVKRVTTSEEAAPLATNQSSLTLTDGKPAKEGSTSRSQEVPCETSKGLTMETGLTLEDLLKDVDPHSVAAHRTHSQLRKLVARDNAHQRAKATALHRQKLEAAAAKRRQRQQTTPTAGESPIQALSEPPESAAAVTTDHLISSTPDSTNITPSRAQERSTQSTPSRADSAETDTSLLFAPRTMAAGRFLRLHLHSLPPLEQFHYLLAHVAA